MIQISYTGSIAILTQAVAAANSLFQDDRFYDAIAAYDKFDYANVTPAEVARLIRDSALEMTIALYKPWNPFSKAVAYDDPLHPTIIHLNARKMHRDIGSHCNTLVHECVHAVDTQYPETDFGHGNNSPVHKENTAPYWIGQLAEQMISGTLQPLMAYASITEAEPATESDAA